MAPEYDNGMEFCMIDLSTVPTQALANRIITVFLLSFLVFMGTARILGSERKERWFKRRTKYTLLNRRGIFGEYMNFGYPRTWQGWLPPDLAGAAGGFGYVRLDFYHCHRVHLFLSLRVNGLIYVCACAFGEWRHSK